MGLKEENPTVVDSWYEGTLTENKTIISCQVLNHNQVENFEMNNEFLNV